MSEEGFRYLAIKNWDQYQVKDRKGRDIRLYVKDYCGKDIDDPEYNSMTQAQRYLWDGCCRVRGRSGRNLRSDPAWVSRALGIIPKERTSVPGNLRVLVTLGFLIPTNEEVSPSDSDSEEVSPSDSDSEPDQNLSESVSQGVSDGASRLAAPPTGKNKSGTESAGKTKPPYWSEMLGRALSDANEAREGDRGDEVTATEQVYLTLLPEGTLREDEIVALAEVRWKYRDDDWIRALWRWNRTHKSGALLLRTMRQLQRALDSESDSNLAAQYRQHIDDGLDCPKCKAQARREPSLARMPGL
jgi:hypothetical protein